MLEEEVSMMNEAAKTIPLLRQTIRQRDEKIIELNNKLSSANTDVYNTNQTLEMMKESLATKEKKFDEMQITIKNLTTERNQLALVTKRYESQIDQMGVDLGAARVQAQESREQAKYASLALHESKNKQITLEVMNKSLMQTIETRTLVLSKENSEL
jgi:chromosome segregation ATPase